MKERSVIRMPEHFEDCLYAVPAVQELMFKYRMHNYEFHCVLEMKPEYTMLCAPALADAEIVTKAKREQVDAADFLSELSHEKAFAVCGQSLVSATKAYGTLIGTVPSMDHPILCPDFNAALTNVIFLPRLNWDWQPNDVASTRWPWVERLKELVVKDLGPSFVALGPGLDNLRLALKIISGASICIGVTGGLTLMAAALGKPLVELNPRSLCGEYWAAKWEAPDYRLFYGDIENFSAEAVWNSAKILASEINEKRRRWETRLPIRKSVAA